MRSLLPLTWVGILAFLLLSSPVGSAPVPVVGDPVILYSLTECPYCRQKQAALKAAGIPFVEYFVDQDARRMREMSNKLRRAGYTEGGYGMPIVDVNGTILPNNPPLEDILMYR